MLLWAASSIAYAQNAPPPPAATTPAAPGQAPAATVPDAGATQVPSAQTPTVTQANGQIPAPRETPNKVNTGMGFSIAPQYWLTTMHPSIGEGKADIQVDPGTFKYPASPQYAIGIEVVVPVGSNASVRASYSEPKKSTFTQPVVANRNLFGTEVEAGDALEADYKMEYFKVGYEYLTYYWHRNSSEFRVKTLYEFQRISFTNVLTDFSPNGDGTYTLNPASGTRSVNLPTFGIGFEHIISRNWRWDARASGMGLLHRSGIGDAEFSLAYRRNHIEVMVTEKYLRFKTSPQGKDQFNEGTISGPMLSLRYYWKKN